MNAPRTNRTATAEPIDLPPRVITAIITPEFIRLPRPGDLCPHTGLTRSAINELILATPRNNHKPPVKSFVLRQKGARTGIRLVSYDSLVNYIRAHADAGETSAA